MSGAVHPGASGSAENSGNPTHTAAQATPVAKPGPPVAAKSRSLLQRALREGVIITLLVGAILAGVHGYLQPGKLVLTQRQLARFNGAGPPQHSRKIYLAILGSVFDVTSGAKHYGPEGNYHGAAGRDSSLAFISGNFTDDQSDDLSESAPSDIAAVYRWRDFFRNHKTYRPVGTLVGRYYKGSGLPTSELRRIEQVGSEAAAKAAKDADEGQTECNVQWNKLGGKSVWCPEGKGYPRRVADGDTSSDRCLCSPSPAVSAVLHTYEDCAPNAHRCEIKDMMAAAAAESAKAAVS